MISQSPSRKKEKIEHVSNLNGCTEYEIILLTSVFLTSYWMWKVIAMKMDKSFFAMEFLILVIPLILSVTILSNQIALLIGFQAFIIILLQFQSSLPSRRIESSKQEPFINAARCFLQISTCIAILAVDFNAFPRKFAKTETYGISWMDVGVGAFVFSSGLVSGSQQRQNDKTFMNTFKRSLPGLFLGLVRLISTKFADYQEHVSEYGVHWNFFITLGILPFFINLQNMMIGREYQFATGVITIMFYQLVLSIYGLDLYILNAPRLSLVSMNREGLASLFGKINIRF
jgi:phosphatidylinositol glycan class W